MAIASSSKVSEPPSPAPLGLVLAITAFGSLGTGAVANGIFFLAESSLGFARLGNAGLGVALGMVYIPGALLIGPALRALAARSEHLSSRAVLASLNMTLGALCFLPMVAEAAGMNPVWTIWTLVGVYGLLAGGLWPIVESYLSGGRSAGGLRRATGRFNIVWSGAVAASFFGMAPLIERAPLTVLACVGGVHAVSGLLALRLRPEPARHLASPDQPTPPVYKDLLRVSRVMLPLSYIVSSLLMPLLPTLLERISVSTGAKPLVVASWLTARVGVFLLFERWHGWHGRWWAVASGPLLLLAGFVGTVTTPTVPSGLALPMSVASLSAFGLGMGAIYAQALYYAMEVGSAKVDAGGTHEALIGVGYTLGPGIALAAAWGVRSGSIDESQFTAALIASTLGVVAGAAVVAARMVWAAHNASRARPGLPDRNEGGGPAARGNR